MEHPFVTDLDKLTTEELSGKISELYKKLNIAARTGNGYLCDQIRMVIESYNNKYQQKLSEANTKAFEGGGKDFSDRIDIN